jgi:hypothetical protein
MWSNENGYDQIRMEMSSPIFIDFDASDPLMDSITPKSGRAKLSFAVAFFPRKNPINLSKQRY